MNGTLKGARTQVFAATAAFVPLTEEGLPGRGVNAAVRLPAERG